MSRIKVDRITNRAGTGDPLFPNGISVVGLTSLSNVIAGVGTFSNVTIGGTITYDDVTNVDSTGIVTARSGIKVGDPNGIGVTIDPNGNAVFAGILTASQFSGIDTDKISEGNTEVEAIDTGSDGHVKMTTEGGERFRVGPAGQIGLGGANYGTSGQVITSAGSGSAPSWAVIPPSGNTFTGIASGSLASNKPVKICLDGKVLEIKATTTALTQPATETNQGYTANGINVTQNDNKLAYDPDNKQFLCVYQKTNGDLCSQIGEPQGNGNIVWNAVVDITENTNPSHVALTHVGNSRFVVAYRDGDNGLTVIKIGKLTPSTPSISWTAPISLDGVNNSQYTDLALMSLGSGRIAVCCRADNTNAKWTNTRWGIIVGDVTSDTAYSYRNSQGISEDPTHGEDFTAAYNPTDNIIFTVWKRQNYVAYCSSIQVASGNAATITTDGVAGDVVFESDNNFGGPDCIYHPGTNKFITTWERGGHDDIRSKITTINSSTLAITNSSHIDASGTNTNLATDSSIQLTVNGDALWCYWIDQHSRMYAITDPTFDGTTINWSSSVNIATGYNDYVKSIDGFYCEDHLKSNIIFGETYANQPTYFVFATGVTNSNHTVNDHYVGYPDQAYTDGQTATIKTYGNNIDTLAGLTTGSKYFVKGDGNLWTSASGSFGSPVTVAGLAISSTKLLIREPDDT